MILSTFWSSNFYILQRDESNDIKAVTIMVVIEIVEMSRLGAEKLTEEINEARR